MPSMHVDHPAKVADRRSAPAGGRSDSPLLLSSRCERAMAPRLDQTPQAAVGG